MSQSPRIHVEVLPETQVEVLASIAKLTTELGFYLAGGTGLALQLGHRQSVDFDWFRDREIDDPLMLAADLKIAREDLSVTGTSRNTLHANANGVQLSWFRYPYPLLEPLVHWPQGECQLASIRDIAAMKIAAVTQRGAKKDFFDVVAIVRAGFSLAQMLEAYQTKYRIEDIGHVYMSLTWFEDAEEDPNPVLLKGDDWDAVKSQMIERTLELAR